MERNTFRRLMTQAIGPRTQKSFAELCGMTPQYLNRLLHSDSVVPTMDTLTRIAGHAYGGVTLHALCEACGIEQTPVNQETDLLPWKFGSEQKRAETVNHALRFLDHHWFKKTGVPNAMVFASVEESTAFIENALSKMLETDDKTFSCELLQDENGNILYTHSQDVSGMILYPVVLVWEEPYYVCRHKFMLQMFQPDDTKCILIGLDLRKSDFEKAFPREVDPTDEDSNPNDVYTVIFSRGVSRMNSPEEYLMKCIFGKDVEVEVPAVEEGEGFYTPNLNDPDVRAKVSAFFKKHQDMIPENAGTPDNLYADYVDEHEQCEYCNGTFGLVAFIMAAETGFPFGYVDNPTFKQNRPLIMVSDIHIFRSDKLERQTIRTALIPYAAALGVDKVGSVWLQYNQTLPTEPEMNVLPSPEKIAEAVQDFSET